jgi:hypothetical protein
MESKSSTRLVATVGQAGMNAQLARVTDICVGASQACLHGAFRRIRVLIEPTRKGEWRLVVNPPMKRCGVHARMRSDLDVHGNLIARLGGEQGERRMHMKTENLVP